MPFPSTRAGSVGVSIRLGISDETPPAIRSGRDAGYPGVAFIFNWAVRFWVRPGDCEKMSPMSGQIAQCVEGSKTVAPFEAAEEGRERAVNEVLWETFKVAEGASERCDMIQLVFHKRCRATTVLLLTASYIRDVPAQLVRPLQPEGSLYGAESKLLGQPPGFTAGMVRELRVSTERSDGLLTCSWRARVQSSGKPEWRWGSFS